LLSSTTEVCAYAHLDFRPKMEKRSIGERKLRTRASIANDTFGSLKSGFNETDKRNRKCGKSDEGCGGEERVRSQTDHGKWVRGAQQLRIMTMRAFLNLRSAVHRCPLTEVKRDSEIGE
jgi:hypothetical protein